jgi:hypothetical protein
MNDRIIEKIETILIQLGRVESKLDAIIDALHDYDGDEWPEPNDALKKAAAQYNKLVAPCRGHDAASWNEEEMERRMDIIGQNGNEGLHYDNEAKHERNMLTSPSYREWWEQNKERILEEDKLKHEMNMKWKIKGNENRYLDQFEND